MTDPIKILIVEDEALIAAEIKRSLQGLGYEVVDCCYSYESAAAQIPTTTADLVLLDINLGSRQAGEDGIALAALLKRTNPRPFIFLTAYGDKDTIGRAAALQPTNYLIKPANAGVLFAAVQLAIAGMVRPATLATGRQEAAPDFFFVKVGARKQKMFWSDIYCIEASKNYARLFAKGLPADYPVRGTIAFVLENLVPEPLRNQFFRLGRSVCLSKSHVTHYNDDTITCGDRNFTNGKIPVGELAALLGR